jgi:hypothetical protein
LFRNHFKIPLIVGKEPDQRGAFFALDRENIEVSLLPQNPCQIALDFAACCFRQGPRANQNDVARRNVVLIDDGFANRAEDIWNFQMTALRPLDFVDDDQHFGPVVAAGREGRATVGMQGTVTLLNGALDVLRIMIDAANDDDVFAATGDEHFTSFVKKAEIAGA